MNRKMEELYYGFKNKLTTKSGQSRVKVSYSPPSPQTLIPYNLAEVQSERKMPVNHI